MASIKVHLNAYRPTKSGTYRVVFQIIHQRKKKIIYSPYRLAPEYFDERIGKAINFKRKKNFQMEEINNYCDEVIKDLKRTICFLESQNDFFTVSDIVSVYESNRSSCLFYPYTCGIIASLKQRGRNGTANAYQSTLNKVLKYQEGNKYMSFQEIDTKWLNGFKNFLQISRLQENSINSYLRIMRAIYNRAIKEEMITTNHNPFYQLRLHNVKTIKRAIDKESMKQICELDLRYNKQLSFSRDLFLFSYYTRGMSFVDMAYLRKKDIRNDTIYYFRSKTKQLLQVKIIEPLRKLIDKYRGDGDFVLPILHVDGSDLYKQYRVSLRRHNNHLKKLASCLNLSCSLTSYVARHTWATIAKYRGVSVSVISEGLGHSSEKMTYTYLAALDPSILNAANELVALF